MKEGVYAYVHRGYIERVTSEKPRESFVYCGVPKCPKIWECEGGHQGFIKSSAISHSLAHWDRFHEAKGHKGCVNPLLCDRCLKTLSNEFRRRAK